jgi:DNA-directed RNA polymerase specialized sigma24 family protein
VVVLRYLADVPTKDAAKALGCAEGTVKATLSQALRKLRKLGIATRAPGTNQWSQKPAG